MSNYGSSTPFILLAKLKVKEDKVAEYLANPSLAAYHDAHSGICDWALTVKIYGRVGDKVIEAINKTVVPFKVFKIQLGYSRV